MSDKKVTFKLFTIADHEEEEQYLREMHRQGWRFYKFIIPCIYIFEQCEPEDVVYQLDYHKDGVSRKTEYIQMFLDFGWEYLGEVMGYNYFRKPVSKMNGEEEEIFSDDESRMDMLDRVFKGRVVILIVLFFTLICPQLIFQSRMDSAINDMVFWMYVVLLALYVWIFVKFAYKYYKLKQK